MFTRIIIIASVTALPLIALAAQQFIPIMPLPGLNGGKATDGSFGDYINAVFKLSIAAGAALAAIYIAIGGFEYIFSEAMESKKDGRMRIINALYGLLILLLVTVILFIIGGSGAINLDIFKAAAK